MMRRTLVPVAVIALTLLLPALQPPSAEACGGFFRAQNMKARPSLSVERVLIIHDRAAKRQHFIRQVAFDAAAESFGFVVPTPTRPQVESVKTFPFDKLHTTLPFESFVWSNDRIGRGFGSGKGSSPGVQVLEQKKVGSFTAFVLAAQDDKALATWLSEQKFVSTPEADRWLAHYVRMGFYYVAMRYDPPKQAQREDKLINAETIRISFDSALAYYPYFEPDLAKDGKPATSRVMELWVVSDEALVPVAAVQQNETVRWVQPLKEGRRYDDQRKALTDAVGNDLAALLPKGKLVVHTFQDQKTTRKGYGDMLFVPRAARPLNESDRRAVRPLLRILAPALVDGS
jgi:hypothetical protein